jgi:hypothetical protein
MDLKHLQALNQLAEESPVNYYQTLQSWSTVAVLLVGL